MHDYSRTRLTDDFVNLTGRIIYVYEQSTGEIAEFLPVEQTLPKQPNLQPNSPITHYILEEPEARELSRSGRSLKDIAVVYGRSPGRDGVNITRLQWGENPKSEVCLYRNSYAYHFPHL